MRHDLTDITLVLDESGSMDSIRDDTIGSINAFLEKQRQEPGEATFTLATFSTLGPTLHSRSFGASCFPSQIDPVGSLDSLRIRVNATNLKHVAPLTRESYAPNGGTPLLDALGDMIAKTGERLAAIPESQRPGKVLFVIMTDGEENTSGRFTREKIAEMIKHQDKTYSWDFLYLGANQDAIAVARSYNISAGNTMSFCATQEGMVKTSNLLSGTASNYRSGNTTRGSILQEATP